MKKSLVSLRYPLKLDINITIHFDFGIALKACITTQCTIIRMSAHYHVCVSYNMQVYITSNRTCLCTSTFKQKGVTSHFLVENTIL